MGGVMDPAVIDNIIEWLIEVRLAKPGKPVQLTESEIKQLCVASRDIFMQQPNLLELEAPIKICGLPKKVNGAGTTGCYALDLVIVLSSKT